MKQVVVLGSSNTDLVFRAAKIPAPGETVLSGDFSLVQGGKGANQAVAVARAGAAVTFLAKLGNDHFAAEALAAYRAEGIDTSYIGIDKAHPSGLAVIVVDEATGQNSIVVASGANSRLLPEDLESLRPVIAGASVLLAQLETPLETLQYAFTEAHARGIRTVLNPAPARTLSSELLSTVDIITPNEIEAELLTGVRPVDEASTRQAASLLAERVNEAVIITLGSKGVFCMARNGEAFAVPAPAVHAIDTTAAGDVFNGYFVAALASGASVRQAIEMGNRAAAMSVTRKGAQPSIPFMRELSRR